MTDHSSIPLGHTIPAHRAFGWCSHCPDHTVAEELAAWQTREPGDVSPVQAAEVDRLRTENERMRHELEVMYSGAFDSLPSAVSAVVEPPADQTAPSHRAGLRDRIAGALIAWTYRGKEPDPNVGILETVRANAYSRADAVLAVLPEPADRAAILREAADRLAELRAAEPEWLPATGLHKGEQELRRMADESAEARECPPGVHSIFDPCPGNCGEPLPDDEPAAGARQDGATP